MQSPSPSLFDISSDKHAAIAAEVERERVHLMYLQTPVPVLSGVGFAVFLCVMVWPHMPASVVLAWLAQRLVAATARCYDVYAYRRAAPSAPDDVAHWRRRFMLVMAFDAAGWGAMGVLFHPPGLPEFMGLMIAGVIGVAALGVFSLGSVFTANMLFAALVVVPSMLYYASEGTVAGILSGGGLAIFLGMLVFECKRVQTRTIELLRLRFDNAWIAEERRRALMLAERSSSIKSRFLATLSHELRTPLNGVLGMTQLLERSTLNGAQRSDVGVIRRSGAHLLSLIDDLLDLSRIEHGRLTIEPAPFDLRQMVAEVCDLHAATAREKGLTFGSLVAAPLPSHVVADASRVRQVLHNLLGNAIKFTRHGAVDVRVDLDGDDAQSSIRFVVGDTGPGIAEADQARVFEPFEQVAGAAARGGTGLGLAISRELARAMGGDLLLRSTFGQGAEFIFTVPLVAAACPRSPARCGAGEDNAPLSGEVLVVDDSPVNALVAQAVLERMGLRVTVAHHGGEALEMLGDRSFGLVLMDCLMPVLDGIETTRHWRARERERGASHLPIIALTANAAPGERDRCLAAGMDDYVVKPFNLDDLHRAVRRHLRAAVPA